MAQLTPSFLPIVGGTETYVRNLCVFLMNQRIHSDVVTLSDGVKFRSSKSLKRYNVSGVDTLVWPSIRLGKFSKGPEMLFNVRTIPSQIDYLKTYLSKYDVINFQDEVDLSFPLFLRRMNKPTLVTCHSLSNEFNLFKRNVLARKILIESGTLYHVFSNVDRFNLMNLGVPDNKIRVVPHGIDTSVFFPSHKSTDRQSVNITFLGRIEKRKGIIDLLEAVEILRRKYAIKDKIDVRVIGKVWDDRYFRNLLDYTTKQNLSHVTFTGFVENIVSALQQTDIFVVPSLMEVFGIVGLEAMACGLPVVATRVGGIPELVVDGETGFLVPPSDPEILAQKLSLLIVDEKLRKTMGQMGRKRVKNLFSINSTLEKVVDIYMELV